MLSRLSNLYLYRHCHRILRYEHPLHDSYQIQINRCRKIQHTTPFQYQYIAANTAITFMTNPFQQGPRIRTHVLPPKPRLTKPPGLRRTQHHHFAVPSFRHHPQINPADQTTPLINFSAAILFTKNDAVISDSDPIRPTYLLLQPKPPPSTPPAAEFNMTTPK